MCLHYACFLVLGVAIATFMIEFVRLPNLKLAAFFLSLLLLYDVFWVNKVDEERPVCILSLSLGIPLFLNLQG